jgi:outer membrane immunogenic protein
MKTLMAAALGAALAWPASVQARTPDAPFGGFYVGLNAGAAWGASNHGMNPGCPRNTVSAVFCNAAPDPSAVNGTAVAQNGTGSLSDTGFTGGAQLGYSWQRGHLVLGGEADFGALDLRQSANANGTFPFAFLGTSYALRQTLSTDWLATLRARLGITIMPRLLLYATGGAAFTDLTVTARYSDNARDATFPGGMGFGSASGIQTGWTLGGGAEWLLCEGWSIKAEYLYMDFGTAHFAVPTSNTADFTQTMRVDASLTTHIVRAGINYRF